MFQKPSPEPALPGPCTQTQPAGPGRQLSSKNQYPATRYDVGKTTGRPESITETRSAQRQNTTAERSSQPGLAQSKQRPAHTLGDRAPHRPHPTVQRPTRSGKYPRRLTVTHTSRVDPDHGTDPLLAKPLQDGQLLWDEVCGGSCESSSYIRGIPALLCQRQNSGRTGLDDHYSPVSCRRLRR